MKRLLLLIFIFTLIPNCVLAQNGLINPSQIAGPELKTYTAGESFQDQEFTYLDTTSNTLKKLISGVYKSYETSFIYSASPQIRSVQCGTNEAIITAATYSSPNVTLNINYVNNNNPANVSITNTGSLVFSTSAPSTYYDVVYVGDNKIVYFYMKSDASTCYRVISDIKTTASLGSENVLFADTSYPYLGSAYYDVDNDKVLISGHTQGDAKSYYVISSVKTSPSVTSFAPSFSATHNGIDVKGIGNNNAVAFYASTTNRLYGEYITGLNSSPSVSYTSYIDLPYNLSYLYYKPTCFTYLGNNKGVVTVTEGSSTKRVLNVPVSISESSITFGDYAQIDTVINVSPGSMLSAYIGLNSAITLSVTDTSTKSKLIYSYYENNKILTSSFGIEFPAASSIAQAMITYIGPNSVVASFRRSDINAVTILVFNNILPYYNIDPANTTKYIVMGDYNTNEIALCKSLPKKSYSYNYSSYVNATNSINSSLFVGATNKYSPYFANMPVSFNANNIGNTYYPVMPPNESAFGVNYPLGTIGVVLQNNLKYVKGF